MLGINNASTTIMDAYSVVQEKKNDVVAASIANYSGNKNRANATVIGAGAGLLNAVALTVLYKFSNKFPNIKKNLLVEWVCSGFDKWIGRAQKLFPTASKSTHRLLGYIGKGAYGVVACAFTGFALDKLNTYFKSRANGKISSAKQGYLKDSWVLSGANSLSEKKKGRAILEEAIVPTDKGVLVKFKGVNRQYEITKEELKQAYHEYTTIYDKDTPDLVRGYKKNYASADADTIALEIAFRKYQTELREGRIRANVFLPQYANQFSSDNTLSETDVSQFYYLLTGKEVNKVTNDGDGSVKENFFKEYAVNSSNMAACFTLKKEAEDGKTAIKGVVNQDFIFDSDKTYAFKGIYGKYARIVDTKNTSVERVVRLDSLKDKFDTITYVGL